MKTQKTNITKTEWIIMTQLWRKPNQTMIELMCNVQNNQNSITNNTIRVYVHYLMNKGFIQSESSDMRRKKYKATISHKEAKK